VPALLTRRPLRFGDCDPSGIAYFPSYFDMLSGVLEELFAAAGAPFPHLMRERGLGPPTVKLECDFERPGLHGDELAWWVAVARIGGSSADIRYEVSTRGKRLWQARQTIVLTDPATHKAIAWPDDVRAGLMKFMETNGDARNPAA
jgi:4-hydroxybenzoyl-CoA thioesterase